MSGTVLVTGANGFLGRALCRHLQEKGWRVLAAVRPNRPVPEGVEARTAPNLSPDADWRPALEGASHVVHAAARVHQMGESQEAALPLHMQANCEGTLALAGQAREMGVKRFLFISTIKVMGEHNAVGKPFCDQDEPRPEDAYALSKRAAEQRLLALSGMDCVILRPPLIYGPGAGANMASLMRLIDKGIPLPFALVDNRRSLVGVTNLASGADLALSHPQAAGKAFIIKDLDVSTPGLIRLLAAAMGRPARLLPFPPGLMGVSARLLGKGDLAERILGDLFCDDAAMRQSLGWTPPLQPGQELERMAKSFIRGL